MNQHQVSRQRKSKKRRKKMERRLDILNMGFYRDPFNKTDLLISIDPSYLVKTDKVDMRCQFSPIKNQFTLGSCTIFSVISLLERKHRVQLSEMFAYCHIRTTSKWEGGKGMTIKDTPAINFRSALSVLSKKGTCKQTTWPYIKDNIYKIPDISFLEEADKYKITDYARLEHKDVHPDILLNNIKVLLEAQIPIICAIILPLQSLSKEIRKSGILPFCWFSKKGHAVTLVGFDDTKKQIIFRNSWGKDWGDDGYGYIPYDYIKHQKFYDIWILLDDIDSHKHIGVQN